MDAPVSRDLWATFGLVGAVRPFHYDDPETGQAVAVTVSENYVTLIVGPRSYYFVRDTGAFDGMSLNAPE